MIIQLFWNYSPFQKFNILELNELRIGFLKSH